MKHKNDRRPRPAQKNGPPVFPGPNRLHHSTVVSSRMRAPDMLPEAENIVLKAIRAGADAAEACIGRYTDTGVDIEGKRIDYPSESRISGISIRVQKNGRLGFAYCTDISRAGNTIDRALEISCLGTKVGFCFPEKQDYPAVKGVFDARVGAVTPEDGYRFALEMMDAARSVSKGISITGGGVDFGEAQTAIANSNGVALFEEGTAIFAGLHVNLNGKTASTGSEYRASRSLDLDLGDIAKTAAGLALSGRNPKKADSGPTTVVFTPEAFATLLADITIPALFGEAARRGESVYTGKIGQAITAPFLTFSDDGILAGGLGTSSSDDEGTPSRKNTLVKDGVLKMFLYDGYSAAESNAEPTGNAIRGSHRVPPDTGCRNFILGGQSVTYDTLIGEIRDGVVVHELLGAHTANPVSGDFSVTSPLLFRIRRGEIKEPLRPVMLSGNFPEMLRNILCTGKDTKVIPAGGAAIITGSARIDDVMVTA